MFQDKKPAQPEQKKNVHAVQLKPATPTGSYLRDNRGHTHVRKQTEMEYHSAEPVQLREHEAAQEISIQLPQSMLINNETSLESGADTAAANDTHVQRKMSENGIIQRAIREPAIGALPEAGEIQRLIAQYNHNYDQATLDRLVAMAHAYKPKGAEQISALKDLLSELDREAGNRHVVTDRVGLPLDINDANQETMTKNCALTSVGALVRKKASEVSTDLRHGPKQQESEDFCKGTVTPDNQINGMISYVEAAFRQMGFGVSVTGLAHAYRTMAPSTGIAAMKQFPTGTKFLVYLSRRTGDEMPRAHWVFADRYGSQVFFYDYQVGRVQKEIQMQGARALDTKGGGGASTPTKEEEEEEEMPKASKGKRGAIDMNDLFEKLSKLKDEGSDSEHAEVEPMHVPDRMPEASFHPRIQLYENGTVSPLAFTEMFFVAVIPYIANRALLQQKMHALG